MSRLTLIKNTASNAGAQLIVPLLNIVLVPVYLHYIGLEGYGMVALLAAVVGLLSIFSNGIGWAFQREVARRESEPQQAASVPSLLKTLEGGYWILALVLAVGLAAVALAGGGRLVQSEHIAPSVVTTALLLAAARVALAFPIGVYQAFLLGSGRQTTNNSVLASMALAGSLADVTAVMITKSVLAFYAAEVVMGALTTVRMRRAAWRVSQTIAPGTAPLFDLTEIKRLWRFSLGLVWVHGVAVIVKQVDRLVIAKLQPLAAVGIYNAATAGGRLLGLLYTPFLTAVYPNTCKLATSAERAPFAAHVLRNAKVVFVITCACGVAISFFSPEILQVWTHDARIVAGGAGVMSVYIYGNIFIAATGVLYQAETARGKVKTALYFNSAAVFLFPLGVWLGVSRFGIIGAAYAWLAYCACGWLVFIGSTIAGFWTRPALIEYLWSAFSSFGVTAVIAAAARRAAHAAAPGSAWTAILALAVASGVSAILAAVLSFGREAAGAGKAVRTWLSQTREAR